MNYTVSATYTWGEKKTTEQTQGKNVEFYVKEGGKWLLLGDMTIHEEQGADDK